MAAPYRTAPPRRLSAPVLPVRNTVLLPGQTLELAVGRERSLAAVSAASGAATELLVLGQTSAETEEPDPARGDLATVGTVGRIVQIIRLESHAVVTVQGASRVRVLAYPQSEPFLIADAEELDSGEDAIEAGADRADDVWRRFVAYAEARGLPADPPDPPADDRVADSIAGRLWIAREERQRLLETPHAGARLALIDEILRREAARPADARVLAETVVVDLKWTGRVPELGSHALAVAIAALGRVAALVEPRCALLFSIPRSERSPRKSGTGSNRMTPWAPPGGDEDSVRQFTAWGRMDARAMRRLVAEALGRRPQSALGRLLWPRDEPVLLPVLRMTRTRVRVAAPLRGDGRFELETLDGRLAMPIERRGEEIWVGAPDAGDDPMEDHVWEPARIEVRHSDDLRIRMWSRWALWGRGEEPVLLDEVVAALTARGTWQVVD